MAFGEVMIERYQDEWVRGKVIVKGERECEHRYSIIKSFVQQYQGPFTLLDIGANIGYFSFRIAEDFPDSIVVAVEGNPRFLKKLLEVAEKNNRDNVIVIGKKLSVENISRLAELEHFDVVLGMSVIHHIYNDPAEGLDAFLKLGDNLILELPNESKYSLQKYSMLESRGQVIGYGDSHINPGSKRPIVLYKA
jgi:2-polyprenyl-3-methyl-5-hydroxy-6-metoxy-1,4-benzoquinol methylase